MNTNNVFEIRSLLQNSQSIIIMLSSSSDEDVVAAGLSLYMTLIKMRKQAVIVSPEKVKVELSHLYSIDKITSKISGGNNLVISLPYNEGSIEKVSYHIENNKFNLVIEPRGEKLDFNPNQVEYNYGRGDFDLIFVLGAESLLALGELYNNHKTMFNQKTVVNIDKSNTNTRFGKINLVEDFPVSLTMAQLMKDLRLPLDQDAASNLYTGIVKRYGSISIDAVDPRALDVLSFLGRLKATNLSGKTEKNNQQNNKGNFSVQPSDSQFTKKNQVNEVNEVNEVNNHTVLDSNNFDTQPEEQVPEDWLKPKIFTTNKQGRN